MVNAGILSKNMKLFFLEGYMAFWSMTMCSDTFHLSDITPAPDTVTELGTLLGLVFLTEFSKGFQRTFATDAAYQKRTLTPSDTWSYLIWDLHIF